MIINSTSYKEFLVKILEDRQKKSVTFIRLISTLVLPLVIVSYGNIFIKTEWREYNSNNTTVLEILENSLTSTGLVSLCSFPVTFKTFKAEIALIMPNDPSYIPASITVSCFANEKVRFAT